MSHTSVMVITEERLDNGEEMSSNQAENVLSDSGGSNFSLHGRVFDLQSSSASTVKAGEATRFRYFEEHGVIWGEYSGDTVTVGRMTGKRTRQSIELAYAHSTTKGDVVFGNAISEVSVDPSGKFRLTEHFKGVDGTDQLSICCEI